MENKKTPEKEKKSQEEPETVIEAPKPDPLLMRQQQYKQQLANANEEIMQLRQQKQMMEDLIAATNDKAQQLVGALKEISLQTNKKE